jgi:hypothetical protein
MAVFRLNQPVSTNVPVVIVDAGLPAGTYRFRLVVVDDQGNQSAPDEQVVTIVRGPLVLPVPPLEPVRPAPFIIRRPDTG